MKFAAAVAFLIAGASCSADVVPIVPKTASTPSDSVALADSARADSVRADSARADSLKVSHDTTKPAAPDSAKPKPPPPPIPIPPVVDTVSPTGRQPRLIWTARQQAVWDRMRTENHPLYRLLAANCADAVAGHPRYGDRGLWCTIMYQITGDLTDARAAWKLAQPAIENPPASANDVRQDFIENAVMFDWLYPALSTTEREQAIAGLNGWGTYALGINTARYVGGVRIGDSDANIGYYFGLAATDLATAGLSAAHVNWLNATQPATSVGGAVAVGGLDATGTNRQTLRNTINQYAVQVAAGGEWFESTDYNLNTQVILALGAAAMRTATGADHFPEITAFFSDAASAQVYFTTPDLRQAPQWGDVEQPRDFLNRGFELSTWLGTVAGLAEAWNASSSASAEGLLQSVFAKYGMSGTGSAEPWARFFLFYDPYGPATASAPNVSARAFAGTGHLLVRNGQTLFDGRMSNPTGADHDVSYLRDFQLYRNGEWVITHPIGYGGGAQYSQGVNSLLVAGLSSMTQRGAQTVQSGADWWSIRGVTGGQYYGQPYYNPPPTFLRQWQSTVVYLQRGGLDIIVVQDSVDMDDPRTLASADLYRAADLASITNAPALLQWVIHAPVQPSITGAVTSWHSAGGQAVMVYTLAPTPTTSVTFPEASILTPSSFHPSELTGYQIRTSPTFTGGSIVVRQVIIVGSDQPPAVSLNGSTVQIGPTSVTFGSTVQVTN